jgi:hypothetical protein
MLDRNAEDRAGIVRSFGIIDRSSEERKRDELVRERA